MPTLNLDGTFTQLVLFELDGESAQQTLPASLIVQSHKWVKDCSGFISANLHVSEDGKRLFNYAQWKSRADWQAFIEDPQYKQLLDAIAAVHPQRVDANSYSVAAIVDAASEQPR